MSSTKHVALSIARSLAILTVLIGGSAFLQCASTPNPKPTPAPTPTPTPTPPGSGCDAAYQNLVKLGCDHSDAFPDACAAVDNPRFVDCVANATSCQSADTCNDPPQK